MTNFQNDTAVAIDPDPGDVTAPVASGAELTDAEFDMLYGDPLAEMGDAWTKVLWLERLSLNLMGQRAALQAEVERLRGELAECQNRLPTYESVVQALTEAECQREEVESKSELLLDEIARRDRAIDGLTGERDAALEQASRASDLATTCHWEKGVVKMAAKRARAIAINAFVDMDIVQGYNHNIVERYHRMLGVDSQYRRRQRRAAASQGEGEG